MAWEEPMGGQAKKVSLARVPINFECRKSTGKIPTHVHLIPDESTMARRRTMRVACCARRTPRMQLSGELSRTGGHEMPELLLTSMTSAVPQHSARELPETLVLSSGDVARLEWALTTLLSPFEYERADASHRESRKLRELATGRRGVALLRRLLPALEAGANACARLARLRPELAELVDGLSEGLAMFDIAGRIVHENPAITRLLSAEPERERIRCEMCSIVRSLAALAPQKWGSRESGAVEHSWRELQTGSGRYRVRGRPLGAALSGAMPMVLVTLERINPEPLSDTRLQQLYRLTVRETEVARHLARGSSNDELADDLGISPHTARRHTENVLSKLGVASRAAVGSKLYGG